jgi:hypothetical protein
MTSSAREQRRRDRQTQRLGGLEMLWGRGDEIASIGRLLTERWLHRRRFQLANGAINAQAEKAAEAAQRPKPFAYAVRS